MGATVTIVPAFVKVMECEGDGRAAVGLLHEKWTFEALYLGIRCQEILISS